MEWNQKLENVRWTWLVTGAAGFIGSHICEFLLKKSQKVRAADNFSTGFPSTIQSLQKLGGENFEFFEGNVSDSIFCQRIVEDVNVVLHQAALGSVPRSIEYPLATHWSNVDGMMNMMVASKDAGIKRFVYASSSSVYGDHPQLPKKEELIGTPQSPYAVTKLFNEIAAKNFQLTYGMQTVGLRYFNVFGPRQDPAGPYAAVIPRWITHLLKGEPIVVNGDGETSRDFCHVDNVVQANLCAALTENEGAFGESFNVAFGESTSLNELLKVLIELLSPELPSASPQIVRGPFRAGDIRHSLADISKAKNILGFNPAISFHQGLEVSVGWYVQSLVQKRQLDPSELVL